MAKPHLLNVYIFDVLNNTRYMYMTRNKVDF